MSGFLKEKGGYQQLRVYRVTEIKLLAECLKGIGLCSRAHGGAAGPTCARYGICMTHV
ncbi:MAG: hypothetical protein K2M65_07915 [Muribaculaceae bacterium]|nr:hypothetical protein [Muribaculaceae bacterium]